MLRALEYKGEATCATVLQLARAGLGRDPTGRRAEFIELVKKAEWLTLREGQN